MDIILLNQRTICLVVALAVCSHVTEATGLCEIAAKYQYPHATGKCSSILSTPVVALSVDPEVGNWSEWNQHLYLLVNTATDWETAVNLCQEKHSDAYLVYIESEEENNFVHAMMTESDKDVWIGLTDADEEGVWKWGSIPAVFFMWSDWSKEPDGGIRENCAAKLQVSEAWYDQECQTEMYFMCELEIS